VSWAAQAVHTTGINWASVLTIVCAVVGALAVIFGAMARWIAKSLEGAITAAIDKFRIEVVSTLATDLAVVKAQVANLINTRGRDTTND
jgi:hypothetical protein